MSKSAALLSKKSAQMVDDIFTPYVTAATFLGDENLVWDGDFNAIRKPLALSLHECATTKNLNPWLLEVAYRLIDTTKANA